MPGMAGAGMEITLIELNKIIPNDYNPNVVPEDTLAKLRAEIADKGLCEPIIVRGRGDDYEIVDGYHRWLICRDLGMKEIPCIVQGYDSKEARIKTLQLNYMRGSPVPIKLASLIHELSKEISLEDLAKRLPYEPVQLMDNLELLKLPEDFGRTIEEQAKREERELPVVLSFVLYREQAAIVEQAINNTVNDLPQGAKNLRGLALERICADFIAEQEVKQELEQPLQAN